MLLRKVKEYILLKRVQERSFRLGAMVKLASVRETRMYGPPGIRDACEIINALVFVIAALLLLAGCSLLLPGYKTSVGLWLVLIALALVVLVNLHDLYAQLAGFDFRLPLLTLDPQLALIEVAAPFVQAIGGILFFIGVLLLLRVERGAYSLDDKETVEDHAYRLFIAGPALWLLGSIHNAFQVYEKVDTEVQALQKTVSLPFVIGSTLLLVSGILCAETWPTPASKRKGRATEVWFAIVGSAVLVLGAVMNAVRIARLQQIDRLGGHLEPLRGGAQERLEHEREHEEPLIRSEDKYRDIESDQALPLHTRQQSFQQKGM